MPRCEEAAVPQCGEAAVPRCGEAAVPALFPPANPNLYLSGPYSSVCRGWWAYPVILLLLTKLITNGYVYEVVITEQKREVTKEVLP